MIFEVYKNEGETPLETLGRMRLEKGIPSDVPMTYAGRLDPLATGLLIVLTGEDVHKKEEWNGLSKTYHFEILFGVATDTGDILGDFSHTEKSDGEKFFSEAEKFSPARTRNKQEITKAISSFLGKQSQNYPMYSSKTVDGIPLWQYAREGKEVVLPNHQVEIFNINVVGFEEKNSADLLQEIKERITKVNGDFRQQEILQTWQHFLQNKEEHFLIAKCVATVSSGTYIRQLCIDIGEKIGIPALAWRIERTEILGKS